jgi:hypothetical protein
MKNQFIVTLLIFCMSATVVIAQTKKPTTTTKKPSTTVKSTSPKPSTVKKPTTTTTTTTPTTTTEPAVVEEKKTTTTTTTTTPTNQSTTSSTTTTTQSSGPSKGKKTSEPRVKEPKPERVREPKPERVREPRPERVKTPREPNGSSGGVKFGLRVEASQALTFESGGSYDISPGVNAGLFANIPLSEKVSFQPEVLYSMQILKVDPAKYTTNSILAPVTFNFNLGSGNTKFVISPGGYAEYWLGVSNSTGGGVSVAADLTGVDKFYYGAVLGLGVKINSKLLIETRAFYDLKTSNNKDILATFGIGYMF